MTRPIQRVAVCSDICHIRQFLLLSVSKEEKMLACLGLIFMTQWLLLVAQMYDDWQCTNCE